MSVSGVVEHGFGGTRQAFQDSLARPGETGGSLAVYQDGKLVVDLWGGTARPGAAWGHDTLVCGFSTVKPVLALAVGLLADRGLLDVDVPVSRYWADFGAAGKTGVTTAHVLTHTAGLATFPDYQRLVSFDDPLSFGRTGQILGALAAAAPGWEPGTAIGSHSISIGWLLDGIVRAVSGRTIGEFVAGEIAGPLGIECYIGLPAEQQHRAADLIIDGTYDSDAVAAFASPETPAGRALFLGPRRRMGTALATATNDPTYRAFEVPAANAFTTARSLAAVYHALAAPAAGGERILSDALIKDFTTVREEGVDAIFGTNMRLTLGFLRPADVRFGPNDAAFGFPGQGGQIAFGDPVAGLGFAYLPGRGVFSQEGTDARATALIDAVYADLG